MSESMRELQRKREGDEEGCREDTGKKKREELRLRRRSERKRNTNNKKEREKVTQVWNQFLFSPTKLTKRDKREKKENAKTGKRASSLFP